MSSFTPVPSLLGGLLIGLSAAALLLLAGRQAGITGVLSGGLGAAPPGERAWRLWFAAGLLAGGAALGWRFPAAFAMSLERSPAALVVGGLLVGFGTGLGGGCTSGHGVCGLGRGSRRSLVAVITFMAVGAATALAVRLLGGRL